MKANPFLDAQKETELRQYYEVWFHDLGEQAIEQVEKQGFKIPSTKTSLLDQLPDEWEHLMEHGGIVSLSDKELEEYLEKWIRVIGHAYLVQGVWNDRYQTLIRTLDFVKDFIFANLDTGSREIRDAIASSHPIFADVQTELIKHERKLNVLNSLIRKWEKIEFSISRTITNRQGRPTR